MKNLKIFTDNIEGKAINQINKLLDQEAFKTAKVRIMPDVHAGKGCVIGFTGDLGDKVIPNIVGVDIGCGMLCVNLGNIDLDLERLDKVIRQYIPSGFNVHKERKTKFEKLKKLNCYHELKDIKRIEKSIGTLGGGNHFIEIDVDEDNNKYLIIHTGSRNLGKQVANYYQELANQLCNFNIGDYKEKQKELIKKYKREDKKQEIQSALETLRKKYLVNVNKIPRELAYLEGKARNKYLHDMEICQRFAQLNREEIARLIISNYGLEINCLNNSFETVHNYISFDDNIIRKGAISARKGEKVLIPMNMRDGCIIALGKGNNDWNQSAPHGAGRIMTRMKAKETLTLKAFEDSMDGIYTTSVSDKTIDESPMVYKPMDEIVKNIKDTVEIERIIKPIYNFKASE